MTELKVGDSIYTPANIFCEENPTAYLHTQIKRIYKQDGKTVFEDTDGIVHRESWIGDSIFLTYDDMLDHYKNRRGTLKDIVINYELIAELTGRKFDDAKDLIYFVADSLDWLQRHNKNYTNEQYGKIDELKDIFCKGVMY